MTRGPISPIKINLPDREKEKLEELLKGKSLKSKIGKRIKLILMLARGYNISYTGRAVGLERRIVRKWAYRFLEKGIDELLKDKPRPGRPKKFSADVRKALLKIYSEGPQKYGIDRKKWTCKALRDELVYQGIVKDISPETIRRMLKKDKFN